jgi:3-hydroxyacyl-CoA dehydrogenase
MIKLELTNPQAQLLIQVIDQVPFTLTVKDAPIVIEAVNNLQNIKQDLLSQLGEQVEG